MNSLIYFRCVFCVVAVVKLNINIAALDKYKQFHLSSYCDIMCIASIEVFKLFGKNIFSYKNMYHVKPKCHKVKIFFDIVKPFCVCVHICEIG